jgi:hypothetical protein
MLGFVLLMIVLLFIWMGIIQFILNKEQKDEKFATKLNRFRDFYESLPRERIKMFIGQAVIIAFLIYAYFFSGYSE